MSSEDLALKAVDLARNLGASYVDTRFEITSDKGLLIEDGSIEHFTSVKNSGIGIRVLVDGAWGFYSLTNPNGVDDIRNAVERAFKLAKSSSIYVKNKVVLADIKAFTDKVIYSYKNDPRE